ncbi:hypothetical protein NDI56_03750 [Haloarcula sp. S1CR25-12]|uniref:Uncharacterized protein n=1 Tax=Haloarcula saliterrae TaxID=2950534 RepID=A0ABU2F8E6_9EURY|nr:hypothetical protein [Haloarcula sp. S1CR25-12]MDS0258524.1 hypothetical protein [Haloarcula sp. S1CR25-12]
MSSDVPTPSDGDPEKSSQEHLQDIFLEVTGTEVCVETQEQNTEPGRDIAGEESSTAEYVSTMVRDDGLSETLAEPSGEGQPE